MKLEFEKLDLIVLLKMAIEWLRHFDNWHSWSGLLVVIIMACIGIASILWIAEKFFALIAKIVDFIKPLGLSVPFFGRESIQIKLRQQFCRVLRADLEKIASGENWSDQWFTDLEAEVEAEGRFYISRLHKMLRRSNSGSRKEPSLMHAITRTSERCMLLVGDPGAGKSVALRHLAQLLAESGVNSRAKKILVPLYVNLREFTIEDPTVVNADLVRAFVLDHVRRGDSSTAQYVEANWDDFFQKGTWYFLFDSFDEIPAILHAEKGSRVIDRFSEAIRQFMDGMGECSGILASREYKGPEALPWQKLRILPLDNKRQLRLIDNAVLTPNQASIVRSQLAIGHSSIYKNPLFLSLLCKFVKDHERGPEHNYALLMDHLDQLSRRDPDWVSKHCHLTAFELLIGAEKIASILAQNDDLGLAPMFGELSGILSRDGYSEEEALNLLNGLVYVKIGRNDVKEARQGDRRFAFAHRRYQESLFVKYLVRNSNILSPQALLFDQKWREYTVALLQSQDIAECVSLLAIATKMIRKWADNDPTKIDRRFIADYGYFEWKSDQEVHLLGLLQEGLMQRLHEIPSDLSSAIEMLISKRWDHGDCFDKVKAIELGGLVPAEKLENRIIAALDSRVPALTKISFAKVAFLQSVPVGLANWVRKRVSDETIVARDLIELSTLDLLVSRLPTELGAQRIFNRNKFLRALFYKPVKWIIESFAKVARFLNSSIGIVARDDAEVRVDGVTMLAMSTSFIVFVLSIVTGLMSVTFMGKLASIALTLSTLSIMCIQTLRDAAYSVTPLSVFSAICKTSWRGIVAMLSISSKKTALFILLVSCVGAGVATYIKSIAPIVVTGMVFVVVTIVIGAIIMIFQTRRSLRYLQQISNAHQNDETVLFARTNAELLVWLSRYPDRLLNSKSISRSLLRMLEHLPRPESKHKNRYPLFGIKSTDKFPRHKNLIVQHLLQQDRKMT